MTAEAAPRPTPTQWLAGARPHAAGGLFSSDRGNRPSRLRAGASWVAAILALVVSLALQVGVLRQ